MFTVRTLVNCPGHHSVCIRKATKHLNTVALQKRPVPLGYGDSSAFSGQQGSRGAPTRPEAPLLRGGREPVAGQGLK